MAFFREGEREGGRERDRGAPATWRICVMILVKFIEVGEVERFWKNEITFQQILPLNNLL